MNRRDVLRALAMSGAVLAVPGELVGRRYFLPPRAPTPIACLYGVVELFPRPLAVTASDDVFLTASQVVAPGIKQVEHWKIDHSGVIRTRDDLRMIGRIINVSTTPL